MSRSLRRHQQAVARVRKWHIIRYWYAAYSPDKPWKQTGRLVMNEPGYWVHEWMTVPARRRQRRAEHAIVHGLDPDWIVWPDNRKPHKYYW